MTHFSCVYSLNIFASLDPFLKSTQEWIKLNQNTFLYILAIFGGIDLALRALNRIVDLFPGLLSVQAKFWRIIYDLFRIASFRRKAIATQTEEVLNQTAFVLERYLPKGWLVRAKIEWVRRPGTSGLRNGAIILRVRPGSNADENLMNALWAYFSGALFPETRDMIPVEILSSIGLAVTRAGIEEKHKYLLKDFDNRFLRTVGEGRQGVLDHFGDCVRLNDFGLLMGPFLREIDYVAKNVRFRDDRIELNETISRVVNHMLSFQPFALSNKPEKDWILSGSQSSYAFILVSRPPNTRPNLDAYIRRAKRAIEMGAQRIYIIGRNEEREFVKQVIQSTMNLRELKGIETFPLIRDYRGDDNGIGALVGLDEMLAKLNLSQRSWDSGLVVSTAPSNNIEIEASDSESPLISARESELSELVEDVLVRISDYEGQWISLAVFGAELRLASPEFTPRLYGGKTLLAVLRKLTFLEFDERGPGPAKSVYVRTREGIDSQETQPPDESASDTYQEVVDAINKAVPTGNWVSLARVGAILSQSINDFDCANYGAISLHNLVEKIALIEIEERGDGFNKTYVRVKSPVAF